MTFSLLSCMKMAGGNSIKLFQFNQKYFQAIGIELKWTKNCHALKLINWIFIISLIQLAMVVGAFLMYDANSIGEYGIALILLVTIVETGIAYLNTIWKMEHILQFTENCEVFIENSG